MTAPVTVGQLITATFLNELERRKPTGAIVATSQTTTSDAYTNLATVGPAVTVTTGQSALVILNSYIDNDTDQNGGVMNYAISGATTRAAADPVMLSGVASGAGKGPSASYIDLATGLTAGSNTFTAKYRRAFGGTARFIDRELIVIPQD